MRTLSRPSATPQPFAVVPEQYAPLAVGVAPALATSKYATMGERFLAFLCDACVESVLVAAILAVLYPRSSLSFQSLSELAAWTIPAAYMTLAEFLFHGTIGKRLLRIKLQSDTRVPEEPSFFRILLREAIGKPLCSTILGIGFLVAVWNAKKKTWADRMARTVVVRTGAPKPLLKAVLVPVLICGYFGAGFALWEMPQNYQKELSRQLSNTESRIDGLHEQILKSLITTPKSPAAYQQALSPLASTVEAYKRLLTEEQDLTERDRKLLRRGNKWDADKLFVYDKVNQLRQEIASLVSRHVQMVLAFDPHQQAWAQVLHDRKHMISEIESRNNRINRIGSVYVPRKISFDAPDKDLNE